MRKYIFITGGVMSSLGKGIIASSVGLILKAMGKKVSMLKFDPYLNVDAGSMNPYQHGEVFVTADGGEVDLDLGHYERFLGKNMTRINNVTSGNLYKSIIEKERRGDFLGQTIQVIPHLTHEIKERIRLVGEREGSDVIIIEIGGTVGDIESLPFLEAAFEFKGEEDSCFFHVTYVPYLETTKEFKTKPTQHSVKELRSIGIHPDALFLRSKMKVGEAEKRKISKYLGIPIKNIFGVKNLSSPYFVPEHLLNSGIRDTLHELGLEGKRMELSEWFNFTASLKKGRKKKKVGIIGKYVTLKDSYISLEEAILHAGAKAGIDPEINWISSEEIEKGKEIPKDIDGIIIPGGFGKRGIEGMIMSVRYARENRIPLLGICLGLQIVVIEFFRNRVGWRDAHSTEFDKDTDHPVIDLLSSQREIEMLGGTMRLGEGEVIIEGGSLAEEIYKTKVIRERHRHRYTFNLSYLNVLKDYEMDVSGRSRQGEVEIVEIKNHPFFIGVQFHPEFSSKPLNPNPLFVSFLKHL
ncbi:MAG: CTP synthetase [Caldiserica bacterium]|nr:MAG: CTP synthetase [Caldisericota bacterium]